VKNSGVVEQDIDSAEGLRRLFKNAFNVSGFRYVGSYGYRGPAGFAGHVLNPVFPAAHHGDVGTFAGQGESTSPANAAAGAGHDGYLVFQARVHGDTENIS